MRMKRSVEGYVSDESVSWSLLGSRTAPGAGAMTEERAAALAIEHGERWAAEAARLTPGRRGMSWWRFCAPESPRLLALFGGGPCCLGPFELFESEAAALHRLGLLLPNELALWERGELPREYSSAQLRDLAAPDSIRVELADFAGDREAAGADFYRQLEALREDRRGTAAAQGGEAD